MFGIIDVGGGTRDIFGAGVLDLFMDEGIQTDYFIGVSAGTANGASYLSEQRGRNYRFYQEYSFRKEYIGPRAMLNSRSWVDLDYVYSTLSNEDGEDPLDYDAFAANPAPFDVVTTDARTGLPVYFTRKDIHRNQYDPLKASSCVPVFCRPYPIGDGLYYDGGLSDPIPLTHARAKGIDKLVLILTRPKTSFRDPEADRTMTRILRHRFPEAARTLSHRADIYNIALREALEEEAAGWVKILAPDNISGMRTLTRDHDKLEELYQEGYRKAQGILDFLRQS